MTQPPPLRPATRAAAAPGTPVGWLIFAPLVAVVGLRWVLDWLEGRAAAPPAWRLAPFVGEQNPFGWLAAAGWALAGLALLALVAWWVRRRWGQRALARLLAALWLLAALVACAAQVIRFVNLRGLVPQAEPLAARVLGSRSVAPSARGPGGTLLVLQVPGMPTQQALVDDSAAARLQPGQPVALRWAGGRWSGRYVTGWQVRPPQPARDNPRP